MQNEYTNVDTVLVHTLIRYNNQMNITKSHEFCIIGSCIRADAPPSKLSCMLESVAGSPGVAWSEAG